MSDLSKVHTKVLKKQLRSSYSDRDSTYEDSEKLRAELNKREHINTSAQSALIRKMSKKAGKKLTLKQAQLLNNKMKVKV